MGVLNGGQWGSKGPRVEGTQMKVVLCGTRLVGVGAGLNGPRVQPARPKAKSAPEYF